MVGRVQEGACAAGRTVGSEEASAEGSEWEEEHEEQEEEENGWEEGRIVWGLPWGRLLFANFPRLLNKSSYTNSVADYIQHLCLLWKIQAKVRKYTGWLYFCAFCDLVLVAMGVEA